MSTPTIERSRYGCLGPSIALAIIVIALSSCSTSTPQSVTTHPDGSTTTAPVLSPKDQAFHEACQSTLNCKF